MSRFSSGWVLIATLTLLGSTLPSHGESPQALELRDDRGQIPGSPIEVCFYHGLETQCSEFTGQELVALPDRFDSLRVEGSDHGPVSLRRHELPELVEGLRTLEIPRKVTVRVEHPEKLAPTLSLYDRFDRSLRRPTHRIATRTSPTLKVPAGAHLVSMSARGHAPDLRLVDWPPGSEQRLVFQPRKGWSVVLRTLLQNSEEPVEAATVELQAAPGYEQEHPARLEAETGPQGLAVFSGLDLPLASAKIGHPDTLSHSLPAVTATPGTFGYYEAPLQRGGTIIGRVTLEGEPAEGLKLQLLEYERSAPGSKAPPEIVADPTVDAEGRFRIEKVAEGHYTVRLFPPEVRTATSRRPSVVDVGLEVHDNQKTPVTVDLAPRTIYGTVYRGTRRAPDHKIVVHPMEDLKRNGTEKDAVALAVTNEDGEYELTLWNDALYGLRVKTLQSTPITHKEVRPPPGDFRVDFHLGAHAVEGQVVDDSGEPVEEALVRFAWQTDADPQTTAHRLAVTPADGTFSFPLEDTTGEAEIRAQKSGYQASKAVEIRVDPAGPAPPPMTLILEDRPGIRGLLTNASGAPLLGGWVAAYRIGPTGGLSRIATTTSDDAGRFEIPGAPSGSIRLFYGGPGCPLGSRDVVPSTGISSASGSVHLYCATAPANVELLFHDTTGQPVPRANVLLRKGQVVIPREIVVEHLLALGVPPMSDGAGRLVLVAVEPASYDVYLGGAANAQSILENRPNGFLTSVHLQPAQTTSYDVTLDLDR